MTKFQQILEYSLEEVLRNNRPAAKSILSAQEKYGRLSSRDRQDVFDALYEILRCLGNLKGRLRLGGALETVHNICGLYQAIKKGPQSIGSCPEIQIALAVPLEALPLEDQLNIPAFLLPSLQKKFGSGLQEELQQFCFPAEVGVRVCRQRTSRLKLIQAFREKGISCEESSIEPLGIIVRRDGGPEKLKTFPKGLFEIQDIGSQVLSRLAAPKSGQSFLDFCAGAGGKSLAVYDYTKGDVFIQAMDIDSSRTKRMVQRLSDLGITKIRVHIFPEDIEGWILRHLSRFDSVLVDAPCSGSGTWRRDPHLKWHLSEGKLQELIQLQATLIERASKLVKVGGRLIYGTCSILQEENEDIVNAFNSKYKNFMLLEQNNNKYFKKSSGFEGPFLNLTPLKTQTDGFFGAVLKRVS